MHGTQVPAGHVQHTQLPPGGVINKCLTPQVWSTNNMSLLWLADPESNSFYCMFNKHANHNIFTCHGVALGLMCDTALVLFCTGQ